MTHEASTEITQDMHSWVEIEKDLGLDSGVAALYRRDWRGSRTYVTETMVVKLQRVGSSFEGDRFVQDLCKEHEALSWVQGDIRFVQAIGFDDHGTYRCLKLMKIEGDQLGLREFSILDAFRVFRALFNIGVYLCRKRILHGDLNIHNFLIDSKGNLTLVDFGLAKKNSLLNCVLYIFFIRNQSQDSPTFPLSGTMVRVLERTLPRSWRSVYRKCLRIAPYRPHAPDNPEDIS